MTTHSGTFVSLPTLLRKIRAFDFPHKLGVCERLFGTKIAAYGVCWVETSTSLRWKLDLANSTHRWIVYGDYQGSPFFSWARQFLPRNGIIVDSGANIGQMLLYLGQYVPNGKVLAFEPGKDAADWLQECLATNASLPVELLRYGLGESTTTLFLEAKGGEYLHGSCNQISETTGERVQIVKLDDVIRDRNIEGVSLWKLDVEGHELAALRGAESLLKTQRINSIYAELGYGNGQRIVDYLASFNYRCYFFGRRGQLFEPTVLPEHTDGLFLPVR